MRHIDYFKMQAKNLLKDLKAKRISEELLSNNKKAALMAAFFVNAKMRRKSMFHVKQGTDKAYVSRETKNIFDKNCKKLLQTGIK